MEALGKIFAMLLAGIVCGIVRAWAICKLWMWFVVPQFHLQPLTLRIAYGLTLVTSVIWISLSPEYKDDSTTAQIARTIIYCVITPLLCVGIGWIIK